MKRLLVLRRWLLPLAAAAMLAGCANVGDHASCPDIGGTYANRADTAGERLSRLLLEGHREGESARSVSVAMTPERDRLDIAAGAARATLKGGVDFACDAHGLRLARPVESGVDLGELLVHRIETFHTFTKAPDGALLDATSTREHATIGGVPLAGRERPGAAMRWKPVTATASR